MRKLTQTLALLVLTLSLLLGGCAAPVQDAGSVSPSVPASSGTQTSASLDALPAYSGEPYVALNGNEPDFSADEITDTSFETYSPLDSLGRCGVAEASISTDLMPAQGEKRGSISEVKPSGWVTSKYDFVDGKYLYNRCHLIGWQLTAENANRSNLITGTRYLYVDAACGDGRFRPCGPDHQNDAFVHAGRAPSGLHDHRTCKGMFREAGHHRARFKERADPDHHSDRPSDVPGHHWICSCGDRILLAGYRTSCL